MNVNGITSVQSAYAGYSASAQKATEESTAAKTTDTAAETGVIYEPSKEAKVTKKYKPDTALIQKLKADADARTAQLRSLVSR